MPILISYNDGINATVGVGVMELYPLKVFLTVATERSFSRAGEKLLRTQPAISIAIQRLESDLKEKLIDRTGRELLL
ncbi:MAG: LysR family transcriptional regulator, partial [Acidobacteriaceae bacterium]|nr:LysR family transcriptional regulator [Acidobacteriaceae bacterium]